LGATAHGSIHSTTIIRCAAASHAASPLPCPVPCVTIVKLPCENLTHCVSHPSQYPHRWRHSKAAGRSARRAAYGRRDAEARREARREARVLFTFDMAQVCDKGGRCTAMQRLAARWCVVCGAAVKRSRALQCGSERRSERASPGTQAYCMPRIIQKCANTVRA
jgi:hypothetical protein